MSKTNKERIKLTQKRMEANDPEAFVMMGEIYRQGLMGLAKDKKKGLELMKQAADFGSGTAHYVLADEYSGTGVAKYNELSFYHLRLAAIGGVLEARYNLGLQAYSPEKQQTKLAFKHWVIAARAGNDDSLRKVKEGYVAGYVTKDVFAETLRSHKTAIDEVKNIQRDAAVNSGTCKLASDL